MDDKKYFYIGYISKTRGLKGEVQLFFEFDDYEDLALDVIFLEIDKRPVPFFIDNLHVQPNRTAFLFLSDVDHIDKAEPLVGTRVYLTEDKRPVRGADDFRITDLQGFEVHDRHDGVLGTIAEIREFPQQFIAAILNSDKEILFPLNDDIIDQIDHEKRILEITLPDGLLDLYLN